MVRKNSLFYFNTFVWQLKVGLYVFNPWFNPLPKRPTRQLKIGLYSHNIGQLRSAYAQKLSGKNENSKMDGWQYAKRYNKRLVHHKKLEVVSIEDEMKVNHIMVWASAIWCLRAWVKINDSIVINGVIRLEVVLN